MSGTASEEIAEEARARYDAGEFERAHQQAVAALAANPDDLALLRVAGRASFELGLEDAVDHLTRATTIEPDDAETWHDLAVALVNEGRLADASEAFHRAVTLRPDDARALVDLGHTAYALGDSKQAVDHLRQAAEQDPHNLAAVRALVEIYRREGRLGEALEVAEQAMRLDTEGILTTLDLAEIALDLNRLDEAVAAFVRLRGIDDEPDHEVYLFHGMIEAEMRRERWRRALDLAVDATRVDRHGRTTDVLAFVVAKVFGTTEDRPVPTADEVTAALAASRGEHRRLHEDSLVF
jgi:tetratricopeptide (TPR) repeat protein